MDFILQLLQPLLNFNLLRNFLFPAATQLPHATEEKPLLQSSLTFTFPNKFVLRDLVAITAPVFELKTNPLQGKANESMREWFLT